MEYEYTFYGGQVNYKDFHIVVIASSESEARERALNTICVQARKQLMETRKNLKVPTSEFAAKLKKIDDRLAKIPYPSAPSDPLIDNTGAWCPRVEEFFDSIFEDPRLGAEFGDTVPFDVWIRHVQATVKPFVARAVRVYSSVDG